MKVALLGDARWMEEVNPIQSYFRDRDESNKSLCVYVEIWRFQGTVVSFYPYHYLIFQNVVPNMARLYLHVYSWFFYLEKPY